MSSCCCCRPSTQRRSWCRGHAPCPPSAEEATGYLDRRVQVARAAAGGAVEDEGFLGLGGLQVNDAERPAIVEVDRLLGLGAQGLDADA